MQRLCQVGLTTVQDVLDRGLGSPVHVPREVRMFKKVPVLDHLFHDLSAAEVVMDTILFSRAHLLKGPALFNNFWPLLQCLFGLAV